MKKEIKEKVELMIKNLNEVGEEAMLRGKYRKAFFNLKKEIDQEIGNYLVEAIGQDSLKQFEKGTGIRSAEYSAYYSVAVYLNYYLGRAIIKERSLELVEMLLNSVENEYERQLSLIRAGR